MFALADLVGENGYLSWWQVGLIGVVIVLIIVLMWWKKKSAG